VIIDYNLGSYLGDTFYIEWGYNLGHSLKFIWTCTCDSEIHEYSSKRVMLDAVEEHRIMHERGEDQ
jgi:hypothetical protein